MRQTKNGWLMAWFGVYVLVVGALFLGLPRLLGQPSLMPWDYWWMFLMVTPAIAACALGLAARSGHFNGWAVGAFFLCAIALGLFLGWFSDHLHGAL